MHQLSKSTFLRSLKCQKALYLNKFNKQLRDPIDDLQQATFDQGHKVGQLATTLFPGGEDVSPDNYYDFSKSIARTTELLKKDSVIIYEAAFIYDGVMAAVDVLVKENGIIKIYEVKSSTEVKEVYIQDVGIQFHILDSAGYTPVDFSVIYINNKYVRDKELSLSELFTIESVYEEAIALQSEIPEQITEAKQTLALSTAPDIAIGSHCKKPYDCDFIGYCWSDVPDNSVLELTRGGKKAWWLFNDGIIKLEDIPDNIPLSKAQKIQVGGVISDKATIEIDEIKNFISEWTYPLHFLDFETFSSAIPQYKSSKPYQQLPFQYSLHIQQKDNTIEHFEFIADPTKGDPREAFLSQLLNDIEEEGSIVVYNKSFEKGILSALMKCYAFKTDEIENILNRIVDLMIPFRNKWYYTPAMRGSYSIKKVLPALVPELSYDELEINNGGMASQIYHDATFNNKLADWESIRVELLKYCKLDTFAMVKIYKCFMNI